MKLDTAFLCLQGLIIRLRLTDNGRQRDTLDRKGSESNVYRLWTTSLHPATHNRLRGALFPLTRAMNTTPMSIFRHYSGGFNEPNRNLQVPQPYKVPICCVAWAIDHRHEPLRIYPPRSGTRICCSAPLGSMRWHWMDG